jgi:DEAD/DEAH box helicase domain-containing protein
VATVAVMAEARDLQKSVGSGDGAWFVSADLRGRGQLRSADGQPAALPPDAPFTPTVYLYDAFPGGIGQSEPLFLRREDLIAQSMALVERCDCRAGCPACVGPVLAADESAADRRAAARQTDVAAEGPDTTTPKALALRVLALLVAL